MTYNKLGRTNLTVSKICLGTMHFGPKASEEEAFRIMDRALQAGINFFDTANVYGGPGGWGRSEQIIGNWLAQGGGRREKIVLATKAYWYPRESSWPNDEVGISAFKMRRHAAESLERLQTDHIDLYQVHHIDRRVTEEEFWGSFEKLTQEGDILYMGTSNFPGWGLAKFQMQAQRRGYLGIASEQTMYNLLCRIPELEVLPAAEDFGIGILAYMPLAGGLLTGKTASEPGSRTAGVEQEYGISLSEERFRKFSQLCKEIGEEERNVAIAWTLANPAVSSAIVGIRTVEHLEGVLRAAELSLDDGFMARLNELFDINQGRPLRQAPAPEAYAW